MREKFEHECGGAPCEGLAIDYQECDAFGELELRLKKCEDESKSKDDNIRRLKDKLCHVVHCQNGGLCLEGDCQCLGGFSGDYCELTDDPCQNVECQNGGICDSKFGDAECHCPQGFIGEFCEAQEEASTTPEPGLATSTEQDMCEDIICHNGGFCLNGHCQCLDDFTGESCEESTDPCKDVNCENGGICDSKFGDADCHCPEGFTGEYCEVQETTTTPISTTTEVLGKFDYLHSFHFKMRKQFP